MKLIINNVRGINDTFVFDNLNILSGRNGSGKSTVLQIIKDSLRGKTDIKEGSSILQYGGVGSDYEFSVNITSGAIFESPSISMDLATPGFLLGKGKLISGINKSMDDRRQTISRFLKIDRDGFFKENGTTSDIKGLTSELKTLKTEESVLTGELMEKEGQVIEDIVKPKEVKLINGTQGNQEELDRLKDKVKVLLPEPKEVIFDSGNVTDLEVLRSELDNIKEQGSNIPESCDKCGQVIQDAEKVKESLRKKYTNQVRYIKAFDLRESNDTEYKQYLKDLEAYNTQQDILKQIKEFKLVTTTKGNEEEYRLYQEELTKYNTNEALKQSKVKDIETLMAKIKAIPTIELSVKIKKYKEVELKFVESLKDKLVLGDLEFIFYTKLKSPNTNGEMYKATFEVTYKGKNYNECSGGEQGIIDVMIAYLFLEDRPLLVDNAEISTEKLKEFIKDYCKDKQVFVTRITSSDLKLTNTF